MATSMQHTQQDDTSVSTTSNIQEAIETSWSHIAPFWPLKNLIAVNPLAGFEDLPFEDALKQAQAWFQQSDMPAPMQRVNRESMKWLQAFFDEGQSTIMMPIREKGLFGAVRTLLTYDRQVMPEDMQAQEWCNQLSDQPEAVISECLLYLGIPEQHQTLFLTLMLTTLPGWAAHIQYRTAWADAKDAVHPFPVTKESYLAFRLMLTCLMWPNAKALLKWHDNAMQEANASEVYQQIDTAETRYRQSLLQTLSQQPTAHKAIAPDAQLVFCIDVRSEPFRHALEAQGNYDTYGFAGFFGVPVAIEQAISKESYASCPVLLKPAHTVVEHPVGNHDDCEHTHERRQLIKRLYQSVKYTFTSPFALVETMGIANGLWMGIRSVSPAMSHKVNNTVRQAVDPVYDVTPAIDVIPLQQQLAYASGALRTMGLTKDFAPLVVFCGHGSTTQNNAYATALDCGACAGRHGAPNARILAAILNQIPLRQALAEDGIIIPESTCFLAAEHNTTTDAVTLYDQHVPEDLHDRVSFLKSDLDQARMDNSYWRAAEMGVKQSKADAGRQTVRRSQDWAQVRPEWGLARNAAFIVAPRHMTQQIHLQGRSFLHSYDWQQDANGASLTAILTAPMVVAQWINSQYLFSTLDNVAYGGGSKITKNITGKIGIMQGNASDLMHGLPLQSVYSNDNTPYHEPVRLTTIVYAPMSHIDPIIEQQPVLQKLFGNGWVTLVCIDPETQKQHQLGRDLRWEHV